MAESHFYYRQVCAPSTILFYNRQLQQQQRLQNNTDSLFFVCSNMYFVSKVKCVCISRKNSSTRCSVGRLTTCRKRDIFCYTLNHIASCWTPQTPTLKKKKDYGQSSSYAADRNLQSLDKWWPHGHTSSSRDSIYSIIYIIYCINIKATDHGLQNRRLYTLLYTGWFFSVNRSYETSV